MATSWLLSTLGKQTHTYTLTLHTHTHTQTNNTHARADTAAKRALARLTRAAKHPQRPGCAAAVGRSAARHGQLRTCARGHSCSRNCGVCVVLPEPGRRWCACAAHEAPMVRMCARGDAGAHASAERKHELSIGGRTKHAVCPPAPRPSRPRRCSRHAAARSQECLPSKSAGVKPDVNPI